MYDEVEDPIKRQIAIMEEQTRILIATLLLIVVTSIAVWGKVNSLIDSLKIVYIMLAMLSGLLGIYLLFTLVAFVPPKATWQKHFGKAIDFAHLFYFIGAITSIIYFAVFICLIVFEAIVNKNWALILPGIVSFVGAIVLILIWGVSNARKRNKSKNTKRTQKK